MHAECVRALLKARLAFLVVLREDRWRNGVPNASCGLLPSFLSRARTKHRLVALRVTALENKSALRGTQGGREREREEADSCRRNGIWESDCHAGQAKCSSSHACALISSLGKEFCCCLLHCRSVGGVGANASIRVLS